MDLSIPRLTFLYLLLTYVNEYSIIMLGGEIYAY